MGDTAGERRVVSVLVTDVVGSTTIGEQLGLERSRFLFDEIRRLVEAEVLRFGGTVAQHTGDGVLALFGAPVAHEDDAERAVRAALSMHAALSELATQMREAYGVEVVARAAVNTGPAVVPRGDEQADVLYNALGDTVNVAARLQTYAGSRGTAIGPLTARQVEGRFELEALGELELKGKTEPVAAFLVTGERAAETSVQAPLVGRNDELTVVERLFEDLLDGRGAIVCVTGEPGIGKSRLVTEARTRYGDRVLFLEGQGVSYAETFPYWPVRELIRGWLDVGAADPEARVRLELRTSLARVLGGEADAAFPFLASVLGISPGTDGTELLRDLSRDSVQRQTFDAVHDLVVAMARERPLCLVLDDLHWADEATLELVEELLVTSEEEAVVVWLLYRSERDHGAWRLGERARQRYPHRYHELELRALDDGTSRLLATGAAGAELPAEVTELLAERAGGNPYFLEQALHDLVERGALLRENGGYTLAPGIELKVPAAVQEALQARLDRLAPETRDVVGVASVAGRSFAMPLLERLAPDVRLAPALSDLQRLDLIVEERRRPVAEYHFRHGLLREVAYGNLLESRRRDLHRAAGLALEELHADALEEVYGLLAFHFVEADEQEKAARYLIAAGDAARTLYANQEALEHYRRAVPFLERIGDERGARDALLRIGLAHHLAFEFAASNAAYQEAFARQVEPEPALEPTEQLETTTAAMTVTVPGYAANNTEWWAARHLFRGLLRVDDELNVVPDMASSFEVSEDGLRYVFQLRADSRWSDGTPLTAGDFEYAWKAMRETDVPTAFQLDDIVRADATDHHTLTVELRAPRSYLPYLAASVPLFPWPRHAAEGRPGWHLVAGFPTNGPFVLGKIDDEHLLLRASPTWNGPRGNVLEVVVSFCSRDDSITRWSRGELDMTWGRRRSPVDPDTLSVSARGLATWYLGFATQRPPLGDVRVRRALGYAIDRERHLDSVDSDSEPATRGGWIPPALPAHSHRIGLEHDPELARALLAEAGFPNGNGMPELVLVGREEAGAGDVRDLVDQWSELGVRVTYELAPLREMEESILERAHLWIWGWQADYPDPDGMVRTFVEASPYLHHIDELEPLLEQARSVTDPDERLHLYRQADKLLVAEHVAVVPLTYTTAIQHYRPWVEGVGVSPLQETTIDQYVVRRDQRP